MHPIKRGGSTHKVQCAAKRTQRSGKYERTENLSATQVIIVLHSDYFVIIALFFPYCKVFSAEKVKILKRKYKERCEAVFKKYNKIIFRDKYSAQLFSKLSQVTYIPDIVLGFDLKKWIGEEITQQELICINVINLRENKRTYQERKKYIENYEKTIHAVIDLILKWKIKICILGFSREKSEEAYINELLLSARKRNPSAVIDTCIYNGKNGKELIQYIARCKGLLSTRFHALIIGMALEKRQYPICYDNKLTNFLESIGYSDPYSLLKNIISSEKITDYLIHGHHSDYKHVIAESKKHLCLLDQLLF